ncbi:MAG: hypothetical protein SFV55_14645 [Haliscomenobacter sp.]|uniref:hypothetical protein n=1 Tax=Haliscomenobacter sp. TaxID=2717303 RepID=UPI0029A44DA8|nr:hypothetical protein [Haliscomenobacter sp.]MDX2069664.1 hypothetical protein [Haliscomenobacter sp.]
MGTTELRTEVHHLIDQIDDHFLTVVYAMLDTYVQQEEEGVIGYELDGTPVMAEYARVAYRSRLEAMNNGKATSLEELKKEIEQW